MTGDFQWVIRGNRRSTETRHYPVCGTFCKKPLVIFRFDSDRPVQPHVHMHNLYEGEGRCRLFTLKAHQMFSSHTTPEKLGNAIFTLHFGIRKTLPRKSHDCHFQKASFSNCFPSTLKHKAGRYFQIPPVLKSVYEKLRFSWRISVDGWCNNRNKAAFSNFSGVIRTEP